MQFITEEQSAALFDHGVAYEAMIEALVTGCDDGTTHFPVVAAHGSDRANRFSIKAASTSDMAGLKVGSYWPGNFDHGLPRHNSLILLFDQKLGMIRYIIQGGTVNAYRTAAVDAIAVNLLARKNASTLAILGAGHQAFYECEAISRVRNISRILVVARRAEQAREMVARLSGQGRVAAAATPREACEAADIVVTSTAARAPLFDAAWIRPGTHVASMGSDAVGKQELPPGLFDRAVLYCDHPEQARRIGEFQHARADHVLHPLGQVITGGVPGRVSDEQITVFDSSGLSIQDLVAARYIISRFERSTAEAAGG